MKIPNKKYWKDRATQLEQAIQNEATPTVENIKRAYEAAIKNINSDLRNIFREFARTSGISEDDAKQLINAADSNELYKDLLKLYNETENGNARREIAVKINRQAYGARISRLEALKQKIYIHLMSAQNTELAQHKALHAKTFKRSYYSHIHDIAKGFDVGINFTVLPKRAIERVLSADWLGSNYSTRIWNNNKQFVDKVQQTITDGITAGHSIDRMSKELLDYVAVGGTGQRYIAERLARTETAHFMAEGQLEAYKEAGIEKYQFVAALSERTCDTCGGLDGEVFPVSEAHAGDNYPPIHANCRCTTVLEGFEPTSRLARDPETGKNYKIDGSMTYNEWVKGLTPEQKAAMQENRNRSRTRTPTELQYERYKKVLGAENVPKTLVEFEKLMYNDDKSEYTRLKREYADTTLQNRIRNKYNLTIFEGQQGKHIQGHNNYIKGRSYLTVSLDEAQELVKTYAGTGHIDRDKNGKWKHTEFIHSDNIIGVAVSKKNGDILTSNFTIHYSKRGTHIVPTNKD